MTKAAKLYLVLMPHGLFESDLAPKRRRSSKIAREWDHDVKIRYAPVSDESNLPCLSREPLLPHTQSH